MNTTEYCCVDEVFSSSGSSDIGDFNIKGLWRAVILQAIIDATSNYKRTENRLEKDKSKSWLTGMSDDFILVCSMAGYDPSYVRSQARSIIANRDRMREAMKKVAF